MKRDNPFPAILADLKSDDPKIRDAAEDSFYTHAYQYVVAVLGKLGERNHADSQDLALKILTKTRRDLEKYNPEKASFKTWLHIRTRSHLYDFWRKRGQRPDNVLVGEGTLDYLEAKSTEANGQEGANRKFINRYQADLNEALSELKPEEQDFLLLLYQGNSARKVGEMIGVSHAAVRKRHERILKKLKNNLLYTPER